MSEETIAQLLARIEAMEKRIVSLEKIVAKMEEHVKHPTDFRSI